MKTIKTLSAARGFTLLEVVFTMLLGGMLTVGMLEALRRMDKSRARVEDRLNTSAINYVGNLQLTKLFLDIEGFNYQGEGMCNPAALDFWKTNPQEPDCVAGATGGKVDASCTRLKTLQIPDGATESDSFTMVLNARSLPSGFPSLAMLNPPNFYDASSVDVNSPADFQVSGTLTYNEAKFKTYLNSVGMLYNGAILRMVSPYPSRTLSSDGLTFDRTMAPVLPSITFTVANGNLNTDRPGWLACQKLMDFSPPVNLDSSGLGYTKLDTFFRLIPPRAGREAPAMIKALRVVRLKMKRITGIGKSRDSLVSSWWSPLACGGGETGCEPGTADSGGVAGAFRDERVVSEDLLRFEIVRGDIRQASISFNPVERYSVK